MPQIDYKIDRKVSRKNTYLTVSHDTSVLVKTNFYVTQKEIEDLINKKQNWILKHQKKILHKKELDNKGVYILGKLYLHQEYTKDEFDLIFRQTTQKQVYKFIDIYSNKMRLYPNKISFRKNKTLWGSCSGKNNLSFNIYLARTSIEFIEYVVVHELSHIKYKNHSKDFWQYVKNFIPVIPEKPTLSF